MEEEDSLELKSRPELIPVCKCLRDDESSDKIEISARKQQILTTVGRTESYLRERRVPELIRFLLTKVIAEGSEKPIAYLEKLLNDCMLFRAGHGPPPVLYENKHLEAVVKSFDPGQRGWLSEGQLRRAYITLGLTPTENIAEKVPTTQALNDLAKAQEDELLHLISAGMGVEEGSEESVDIFWI